MDVARAWYGLAWIMLGCMVLAPCWEELLERMQKPLVVPMGIEEGVCIGLQEEQQAIRLTWLPDLTAQTAGLRAGDLLACHRGVCCRQAHTLPLAWRLALGLPIGIDTILPEEWPLLPNIGHRRAQAIAEFQQRQGPWTSLEQLLDVRGIGPTLLATLVQRCQLQGPKRLSRTPETCIQQQDLP